MTQIIVTVDSNADSSLLRKMIENMKGVIKASIKNRSDDEKTDESGEWFDQLQDLKQMIDPSVIDMDDERTRYIMSK